MKALELRAKESPRGEIEEMQFYLKTGCVHQEYINRVLGDQSISVRVMPDIKKELAKMLISGSYIYPQ